MQIKKQYAFFIFIAFLIFSQVTMGARLSGKDKISSAGRPGAASQRNAADNDENAGMDKAGGSEKDAMALNYENADILQFIKSISEITGKNFIPDNNIRGKVTIISKTKIPIDEIYEYFQSVLEVHGYSTVETKNGIKIVPSIEARSKGVETMLPGDEGDSTDEIVTHLISLKYANPEEAQQVLSPFISPKSSVMAPYKPTNMLIVTDVQSNISRLLKIIEAIDVPGTGEEITFQHLKHASAEAMAKKLNNIFKNVTPSRKKGVPESSTVVIEADERTNTLIIVASEVDTIKIREIIELLDDKISKEDGGIYVKDLNNADAEDLAATLLAIPKDKNQKTEQGKEPVLSKDIQIVADKATNSLIITAQKDEYLVLEDVINKLDRPRNKVYIEALIMEVSMSKEFGQGFQWQGGSRGSRSVAVFGGSNSGSNNFPTVDSNGVMSLPSGFSLGAIGDIIEIGGMKFTDIGAVLRAYAMDSDIQIKSAPNLLATDNVEAEIKVVGEVPFLSSKDQSDSGNDYSHYEFKEVGEILKITPQINQERSVRLEISLEVSQLQGRDELSGQPTKLTRNINTTVEVDDGKTIVIGGLISETENNAGYRVPILGRIPVLGHLFRSKTNSNDKKNLYIFLTPHIIQNSDESDKLYEEKKGQIETIKEGVIKMHNDGRISEDMRLSSMGYKYLQLRDYEKALKYYYKALDENPKNPFAILNIGYIYQMRGEKQKATEMYEKLISMDPGDRAGTSTDLMMDGKKLTEIAKDNLKDLDTEE